MSRRGRLPVRQPPLCYPLSSPPVRRARPGPAPRNRSRMLFCEEVSKSFGSVDVLQDLTFIVGDGEHVGLVGPNGCGKSTILRLIAGDHKPDTGVAGFRGSSIGYLRQEAGLDDDNTLLEELWLAFPEARAIENQLADISTRIEGGEGDLDSLIEKQATLFDRFDALDGY